MQKKTELSRLDKAVASQTEYSRREVHRLVSAGKILVNGIVARACDLHIDLSVDTVSVDGSLLGLTQYSYLMLNKPSGVVCATEDAALPTVLDLVPPALARSGLFPAGRLDKDTEGFVLITNDGALSHRILSPKSHVPKTYLAILDKPFDQTTIDAFAAGVTLRPSSTREQRAAHAEILCMPVSLAPDGTDFTRARVVLRQGMFHQIKRMFAALDLTVVSLYREQIGGLALDPTLASGDCRALTSDELALLTNCEQ